MRKEPPGDQPQQDGNWRRRAAAAMVAEISLVLPGCMHQRTMCRVYQSYLGYYNLQQQQRNTAAMRPSSVLRIWIRNQICLILPVAKDRSLSDLVLNPVSGTGTGFMSTFQSEPDPYWYWK